MKRLTLVGIRQEEGDILRALQKAGAVELISVTADDDGGDVSRRLDEATERIGRFSESLSAIRPYAKKPGFLAPAREETLERMQQDVGEAEAASDHIRAILEEKKQIEARLEKDRSTYTALMPWADMDQDMSSIVSTKFTQYFTGLVDPAGEAAIREKEAISAEFYGESGNRAAILACLKEDARLVAGFLKTINWTDVAFPHMKGTPREAMAFL
jgi:vacuolar-type H+-ATPase subunit I/STV1